MSTIDLKNPSERKKLIVAMALGLIAIVFLWWTFIGFGGSSKPNTNRSTTIATASPSAPALRDLSKAGPQDPDDVKTDLLNQLRPVNYHPTLVSAPEAKRNIFSYYEPPPPAEKATETPTPTPTPPVLLAAISPTNVYARTGDFTLEVSGDKFAPGLRVLMDGRELTTRYIGPQQLSANVPASFIANPGGRQIMLRSPDSRLYSNQTVLNVTAPPTPNFNYVGIIATARHFDTAIVQDKGSKDILNVQKGDLLGGRFRVTSISQKELVLVDTNLKIKHTVPFSSDSDKGFNPLQRPMPKVDSEDDEP